MFPAPAVWCVFVQVLPACGTQDLGVYWVLLRDRGSAALDDGGVGSSVTSRALPSTQSQCCVLGMCACSGDSSTCYWHTPHGFRPAGLHR
eukprot:TRINITY_DN14880_c0_g1_i2.p1 TRINITY_DN14880_c0_g1~~TRINITY_DN14880_c0_g1_i2.p1  ORF type:complete len:100 (-),score=8.26 TRINITY_DN14880_c0_g1_i2:289-558(-)